MIAPSEEAIATREPIEDRLDMEEDFEEGSSMPTWLRVAFTIVAIAGVIVLVARLGTRLARR